jgi:hypothetical protein
MPPYAAERQARQDHVAEAPLAPGAGNVDAPAHHGLVIRQLAVERRGLSSPRPGQVGEPRGDLLQAGDVGVDAAKVGRDTRGIDHAVEAAAPLHIPANHAHNHGEA